MDELQERLEIIKEHLIFASSLAHHLLVILYLAGKKSPEIEELYKQILVSRLDIGKIKFTDFLQQGNDVTD